MRRARVRPLKRFRLSFRSDPERSQRVALALIAVVVASGVVLIDVFGPATSYWRDHPVVANLVAGLVLLLITSLFIRVALWEWQKRRWKQVAALAYRALANEAGDTHKRLGEYVDGPGDYWWTRDRWLDGIEELFARHGSSLNNASRKRRIEILLEDPEWRDRAWQGVRNAKRLGWDACAKWSGLMLSSPRSAADLNDLAELNDRLARLHKSIAHVSVGDAPAKWKTEAVTEWLTIERRAEALELRLMEAAARATEDSIAGEVATFHQEQGAEGFGRR